MDSALQNIAECENEVKAGRRGWKKASGITRLKEKMMGMVVRAAASSLEKV